MITVKDKKVKGAQICAPPLSNKYKIDPTKFPKYLSFIAGYKKQKAMLELMLFTLSFILGALFLNERQINSSLVKKLREKEYIVLPDFITASPQSVSDKVVKSAISDFVSALGNINSLNIDENFQKVRDMMSPELKVAFDMGAAEVVEKIKAQNITEQLYCPNKEFQSNNGQYLYLGKCKKKTFVSNEFIGEQDEVLEIHWRLIPPDKNKRWVLQATKLYRSSLKAYQVRKEAK